MTRAIDRVKIVVDPAMTVLLLVLIVSGAMMSRHVFAFLGLSGNMALARQMHLASSHWGFVLMSMHLGLHWNMIMGMARKIAKRKMPSPLRIVVAGMVVYGLWAFIRRDFPTYLLLQTHFVFFDFSEPALLFIMDYLAIIGLFVAASYYLGKILRGHSQRAKSHSAVLVGYGSETVSDPISGMMKYDREQFESRGRQCVIISETQDVEVCFLLVLSACSASTGSGQPTPPRLTWTPPLPQACCFPATLQSWQAGSSRRWAVIYSPSWWKNHIPAITTSALTAPPMKRLRMPGQRW